MQKTADQRPLIQLLEKPGEENRELEEIIENAEHGNFSEPIPVDVSEQKKCAPCGIYRMPFRESEIVVEETEDFYIVDTEDRKGHTVRNMAVYKDHGEIPAVEGETVDILDSLVETTAGQTLYEYENGDLETPEVILYGNMNTFSEHFHLVASDIYGQPEEGIEDLAGINSYLKFEYEDDSFTLNMDESQVRDGIGEYIQQWSMETDRFEA